MGLALAFRFIFASGKKLVCYYVHLVLHASGSYTHNNSTHSIAKTETYKRQ